MTAEELAKVAELLRLVREACETTDCYFTQSYEQVYIVVNGGSSTAIDLRNLETY